MALGTSRGGHIIATFPQLRTKQLPQNLPPTSCSSSSSAAFTRYIDPYLDRPTVSIPSFLVRAVTVRGPTSTVLTALKFFEGHQTVADNACMLSASHSSRSRNRFLPGPHHLAQHHALTLLPFHDPLIRIGPSPLYSNLLRWRGHEGHVVEGMVREEVCLSGAVRAPKLDLVVVCYGEEGLEEGIHVAVREVGGIAFTGDRVAARGIVPAFAILCDTSR
jgi:hypothetical protein